MKIKGAVLQEPKKPYSIEELELDPPKEKEVLVRYAYTGYCHSDLHNLLGEVQARDEQVQAGGDQRRSGQDAKKKDPRSLGMRLGLRIGEPQKAAAEVVRRFRRYAGGSASQTSPTVER